MLWANSSKISSTHRFGSFRHSAPARYCYPFLITHRFFVSSSFSSFFFELKTEKFCSHCVVSLVPLDFIFSILILIHYEFSLLSFRSFFSFFSSSSCLFRNNSGLFSDNNVIAACLLFVTKHRAQASRQAHTHSLWIWMWIFFAKCIPSFVFVQNTYICIHCTYRHQKRKKKRMQNCRNLPQPKEHTIFVVAAHFFFRCLFIFVSFLFVPSYTCGNSHSSISSVVSPGGW